MKNLLILSTLLILFGAAKCGKEDAGNTFELGESFQLMIGQSSSCDCGDLNITFDAVKEDSRCPKFTDCIWEGQATLELSINGSKIEITSRAGKPDLAKKQVEGYTIVLEEVSPYPESGKNIEPEQYAASILVSKP